MTKRLSSKLLSVILTIAICATTVLGCLITASAADDAFSYEWSDGEVTKELDSATIKLTINAPSNLTEDGIVEGYFDLSLSDGLIIKDAQITDGTRVGGLQFDAAEFGDGEDLDGDGIAEGNGQGDVFVTTVNGVDKLEFGCGTEYGYTTLSFELTFGFEGGFAEQGAQYTVNIASNSLWLAGPFGGQYYNHTGELAAGGVLNASCDHVISVKGDPINTDTDNGYTVYKNSYCTNCGEEFGYQLVPSTEPMNGTTICWDGTDDAVLADPEDGEQTGATADSPIIINSAEELHYLATAAGRKATFNKYYKLADGIDKIVLQSSDIANDDDFNSIETADDVQEYFANGNFKKWSENANTSIDNAFAGHFDGNGVTICGLYDNDKTPSGLFPTVHTSEINAGIDETVANNYTKYTSESHASAKLTEDEKFKRVTAEERVVISNVNITNSYIYGSLYMGFVVGTGLSNNTYKEDYWVDIDNCSVYNNYMESSTSSTNSVTYNGLLAGYGAGGSVKRYYSTTAYETEYLAHCGMTVDNCLVYGNKTVAQNASGVAYDYGIGAMANTSMGAANIFTNSIILGATPYLSTATANGVSEQGYSSHRSVLDRFNNVYTDVSVEAKYKDKTYNYETGAENGTVNSSYSGRIKKITADGILGYNAVTACPNLDWGNVWSYGADGEYPSLASGSSNIIYWSGEVDDVLDDEKHDYSTQDGTKENPIIIDSAEELKYIAAYGAGSPTNNGKHYKIADEIDTIILQPIDVVDTEYLMSLTSADAVADYLTNLDGKISWNDPSLGDRYFNGNFDGNGVAIYGMYGENLEYKSAVGLFQGVEPYFDTTGDYVLDNSYYYDTDMDERITIGNFAIRNSYVTSDRRMGVVVGMTGSAKYGAKLTGAINFTDIEVSNCYAQSVDTKTINSTTTNSTLKGAQGILAGETGGDIITWNNMLVYGNIGKFYDDSALHLIGQQGTFKSVPTGYGSYNWTFADDIECIESTVTNSIILGVAPQNSCCASWRTCSAAVYENVYTDADIKDATTYNITDSDIKTIELSDIIGTQAKDNMPNLQWDNDWYTNVNGYPTLAALDETRVSTISNGSFGLTAYNTSYNNDGSLDFNFYFKAQQGYDYKLYVGKTDSKSGYTSFLELAASDVTTPAIIEQLGASAKVFTIPRLSSRDVNTIWVPTVVATNGAVTEWGKSEQIALADYANGILNDEAVYAENVTDATKLADKKVAAALLNYADAATIALTTPNDQPVAKTKTDTYASPWVDTELADQGDGSGDGSSWEEAIIIDSAEELSCIIKNKVDTTGKYYKVADNIKAFYINKDADGNWIDEDTDIKALFESGHFATNGNNFGDTSQVFKGNFDGNGVTIYGLVTSANYDTHGVATYGGLFPKVQGNVTIKNVNISNSLIYSKNFYAGAIVGYQQKNGSAYGEDPGSLVVENCSVTDCYYKSTGSTKAVGAVIGYSGASYSYKESELVNPDTGETGWDADGDGAIKTTDTYVNGVTKVINCYINVKDGYYHTNTSDANYTGGVIGHADTSATRVENCVVIGIKPYSTWDNCTVSGTANKSQHTTSNDRFVNVYTDQSVETVYNNKTAYDYTNRIFTVDDSEIKGALAQTTASALDFESNWMITSGYPQPVQSGYTATGGVTLYWNGDTDKDLTDEDHDGTTQEGTEANPIIIDSAEELAYIASAGPTVTQFYDANGTTYDTAFTGAKHFRIADGIDKIVLQKPDFGDDILTLLSSQETKDYFTGATGVDTTKFTKWAGVCNWDGTTKYNDFKNMDSFCGVFDGNGVEIYGIYMNSTGYGGLFGDMYYGSAVKNVTIKNSYLNVNASGNYRAGAITAYADTCYFDGETPTAPTIQISGCAVANCYITTVENNRNNVGVLAGCMSNANLKIDNCIVYDSEAWYNTSDTATEAYLIGQVAGSSSVNSGLSNSIILDATPAVSAHTATDAFFTNVYTDRTTTNSTVTTVDLSALQGSKAADIVATLNGDNGATWYVGAAGDYPGFEKAGAIPSWLQAEYDANTFSKFNSYSSVNSQLGLKNMGFNLGANPYMSFVFNFDGAYKTDRQNIKVFIEYSVDGSIYVTKEVSVPAFTEGVALSEGGWLSKATSTNHTYEFTDLPIKAFMHDIKVYVQYDGAAADKVTKTLVGTVSAEGLVNAFINANKKKPCNLNAATAEAAKALYFYVEMVNARYA